jgi:large subunit ribosomal protein L23
MKIAMNVWEVLKAPVVTEKSVLLKETAATADTAQVLTFKVARQATKDDIRNAVEEIFGVKVAKIRTMQYNGKMKRQGRFEGKRADWKKAYVTLREGEPLVDYAEAI